MLRAFSLTNIPAMPRRKLTAKVKNDIKASKGRIALKGFEGEALTYLKKYRSLSKARKEKKESGFTLPNKIRVSKNSELYRVVEGMAKNNDQTVKQFVSENMNAVVDMNNEGSVTVTRESEYLINDLTDLPNNRKIFLNDSPDYTDVFSNHKRTTKAIATFNIKQLQIYALEFTWIFKIFYEVQYSLTGNLYLTCPPPEYYSDLISDISSLPFMERRAEYLEFLDGYYSEIAYMESPPKNAKSQLRKDSFAKPVKEKTSTKKVKK